MNKLSLTRNNWILAFATLVLVLVIWGTWQMVLILEQKPIVTKMAEQDIPTDIVVVPYDVPMNCYFLYIDSLVVKYDTLTDYPLSEHLIVRANPWIIDTLANTDYYRMIDRDSFVYDQRDLIILRSGDTILIPNAGQANAILEHQKQIVLDLNIPEFKLRIWDGEDTLHTFLVRVGRDQRKYLEMSGHITDLRTKPGWGEIIRINKNPAFIDPASGRPFTHTRRDDNKTTIMPLIPWIEPEIDGHRYGHLIHPTTNPKTLGKAYSNGCIGVREGDMWWIYYYAPIGTKVHFRYDLKVIDENGDTIQLRDIYRYGSKRIS